MAASVNRTKLREGFQQPIDMNNIYETLRYVNLKKKPENVIPLLPAIERVYPELLERRGCWPCWTIAGEGWGNIGLAKAAASLGKDGRPIIATLKRMQPKLESHVQREKNVQFQESLDALKESIKTYEDKYGQVMTE